MTSNSTLLLNTIFNDPKTDYVGADKLLRRAKEHNPKITLKQVKEFLSCNTIHQVFQKPAPKTYLSHVTKNVQVQPKLSVKFFPF